MPKKETRLHVLSLGMTYMLPAWLLVAGAAATTHPLSLVLLLMANALGMTAICHALGFAMESNLRRTAARRGLVFFVLFAIYTTWVAALVALPAWWLARDGTLGGALALSGALLVALLGIWRRWPAFALPFVWDDAYAQDDERSWLWTALRRSLGFARHLSQRNDLFFTHGVPASIALLTMAVGAISLAGLGGFLPNEFRIIALVIYAIVLMPIAYLILVNRCLRALLAEARTVRERGPRARATADSAAAAPGDPAGQLPSDLDQSQLDATLLCAIRSGQVELALQALGRGGDPDVRPPVEACDQRSALVMAVTLPDLRLLRALIAKGADVNRVVGGITPLVAATRDSYQGRPDAVMTLLANGANPRTVDNDGNTPLHHAALCSEPTVAALLVDAAADLQAVSRAGHTALGVACANANWAVAEYLLDSGAAPDVERSVPALHLAATINDDEPAGVKLLIRKRAQVDVRDALGRTALMACALDGHARIAETLLAAGASIAGMDARGTTALMEAARSGSLAAVETIGKRRPDPNQCDRSGRSALAIACAARHANESVVRALLAIGANRELVDGDGKRAIDHAMAAGRWHLVALLDPTYALPSAIVGTGVPANTAATADHLLDALRFGHWNVVDSFSGLVVDWPPTALAGVYRELTGAEHVRARDWLLNHGLAPDARLADGTALADALLQELPGTLPAYRSLLARGVSVGGAGLLAKVLALAVANDVPELPALAPELLERGADWCATPAGLPAALHSAATLADTHLMEMLLERGADPNVQDAQGRTPLHFAMKLPSSEAIPLVRLLIVHGADPEIASANGETALGTALARSDRDLARWLDWPRWRLPRRPLHAWDVPAAAAAGDLEAVVRLLELGFPIDAEDAQGATALLRASGSGYAGLVAHLLAAGSDPTRAAHSGATCLSAAVSAQRESVVRTLIERAIEPDQRLQGGGTALAIAAALGLVRLAEPLLDAGADPNASDEQGATPLHAAAYHAFASRDTANARALFERLLASGARLDARNHAGQDVLLLLLGAHANPGTTCDSQHLVALATLLLKHGAPLDVQDRRGVTALHACAMHGLLGCARMLKAHGADVGLVDGFGRSAAEVAALLGYVDVAAELGAARPAIPDVRHTLRRRVDPA